MADVEGIDLGVAFNEFDEELGDCGKNCRENSKEDLIDDDIKQKDVKHVACFVASEGVLSMANSNSTSDVAGNLTRVEDGEISSSSEDECVEKMDCDEENGKDQMLFLQQSAKSAEGFKNFTFLLPNSVFTVGDEKEHFEHDYLSDPAVRAYESESAVISMESDNSMDDQSWKRHKRARLEDVSNGVNETNTSDNKAEQRKKTRGGQKKRRRPPRRHNDLAPKTQRGKNTVKRSGNDNLFKPLKVTADDSEHTVAREIAYRLNESKTLLVERIVTCIGCEKAIKLFKDTQEVEKHGGIWTKEGDRRRTSGGVFLVLLKHRYVTKEQEKWIFSLENEIAKKKAKEEQKRIKEFNMKNIADLRLKLQERENEESKISAESN
ncbi:phosphorylated adapter RNA export protein-like [Montipora foliosa]|uniref:phosphorylated adapter RNA export protein-like n=1 Tax=Montipora foliosa TaxID=591990 RepID=UPI0035F13D4F